MAAWFRVIAAAAVLTGSAACGAEPLDLDGDGFPAPVDCNDRNATIFPGAIEHCNGVDDDCDGVRDNNYAGGATLYFRDGDLDGFGVWDDSRTACEPAAGWVENADDCDDGDAAVNPDADEVCNRVDDDCDDGIDFDALDAQRWFRDADLDGFGGEVEVASCEQPEGYVIAAGDCEDGDGAVFPGAEEVCDGVDNDCDGEVDEVDGGCDGS